MKILIMMNLTAKLNVLIKTNTPVVKNEDRLEIKLMKPSSDKKVELMLAISQKSNILLSQPVVLEKREYKSHYEYEATKTS